MTFLIGISWIVFWIIVVVFGVAATKAALITGLIFVAAGLILGERPWINK